MAFSLSLLSLIHTHVHLHYSCILIVNGRRLFNVIGAEASNIMDNKGGGGVFNAEKELIKDR